MDTRERYPYRFAGRPVERPRVALPAGDYAVRAGARVVAAVARKTLENFATSAVDGSIGLQMTELATLEAAAVVIEGRYSDLFKLAHVEAGFVPELVARLQVRHPGVPIVFAESRKLAEEWTYRFLARASVELGRGA
ncbi:MAG: ERCC4 domain-containing protein [Thermoleophilaceae bacterium]|nr:ERCC4 domain-containing protein [Thermoleophilaceae bacterium]